MTPHAPEDEPEWNWVDPKSVYCEWIGSAILSLVLLFVAGISLIPTYLQRGELGPLFLTIAVAIVVVTLMLIALVFWLPRRAYRNRWYRLSPIGLEIRQGIWWRQHITVPLSRVQHTDVAQGPIHRRFGLGKLVVYTAGTSHSSVEVNGLDFSVACRLRDLLVDVKEMRDGV